TPSSTMSAMECFLSQVRGVRSRIVLWASARASAGARVEGGLPTAPGVAVPSTVATVRVGGRAAHQPRPRARARARPFRKDHQIDRIHHYPLTAPDVSPEMMRRWKNRTKRTTGTVMTTAAAAIEPIGCSNCELPVKNAIAAGAVRARSVDVSEIANRKSFQQK